MPTLLELALAKPLRRGYPAVTDEEIEVAIAWVTGSVTLSQVTRAFYPDVTASSVGGKALYRVATCLREAHRRGLLKT